MVDDVVFDFHFDVVRLDLVFVAYSGRRLLLYLGIWSAKLLYVLCLHFSTKKIAHRLCFIRLWTMVWSTNSFHVYLGTAACAMYVDWQI